MATLEDLAAVMSRHSTDGRVETPIPGVSLLSSVSETLPNSVVYEPFLCVIAQGAKEVTVGDKVFAYEAGRYVVVSIDLPVCGRITEARRDRPFLSFSLKLDPAVLAELLLSLPERREAEATPLAGLAVATLPADVLDPVVRLVSLLDTPGDIPVLAPLFEREILYRLLKGEKGAMLRHIALSDSRLSQIGRAIAAIRNGYSEALRIEALADIAGMSTASFHRHFKTVTAMTPLQYQKQIRLQEARRLLVSQRGDAAHVAFTVGYESPSQFSREYARLFGAPPGRDAATLRDLGARDPHRLAEMLQVDA